MPDFCIFLGPSQDGSWNAHPVPSGATVIAKPLTSEPSHKVPIFLPHQMKLKHLKNCFAPKMTVWNNTHPKGQSVPLRQPEPTVYFCKEKQ